MTTLRLLTGFKRDDPPCEDTSYTCPCPFHVAERAALVARGVRPDVSQPWEAKRAA